MTSTTTVSFDTLKNVTRLAIIGYEEGAVGQTQHHEALVPLETKRVPDNVITPPDFSSDKSRLQNLA